MKTAKLIIDGKEIEIQINEEQLKQLCPQKKGTGYERAERGKYYWRVNDDGFLSISITEGNGHHDTVLYDTANYYTDEKVAENNARADRLMRQLRRFAVEHRKKSIDWIDTRNSPWVFIIMGDPLTKRLSVKKEGCGLKQFGTIYFDSNMSAELAIDTFKDELLWYFTEYKDSL